MKKAFRNFAFAAIAASVIAAPVSGLAASAIVEAAKDNCVVGEQADGYIGFVPGGDASDAVRREVRDINQQRKSVYSELARRNGVTIEVTAALTAEKLLNQATAGQCIRTQNGEWVEIN